MSDRELIAAYHAIRRSYIEAKFARDTQRARIEWLRAKAFAASSGGVSERKNAVDMSEELARKGQDLRETTRDLDLLRADVDLIAMIVRLRGAQPAADRTDDEGDDKSEDGRSRRRASPSPVSIAVQPLSFDCAMPTRRRFRLAVPRLAA
jgi:hypothetical protein